MKYAIDVIVIELTNRNDLDSIYFLKRDKVETLNFSLLKKIVKGNEKLGSPIKFFELGVIGNPLLHKNIQKILKLFHESNLRLNIVTNGLNLKEIIPFFDDSLLQNIHFSVYLDSFKEEKNDNLMRTEKSFKKTIESIEYLQARNLRYDILMKICSQNYNEIEKMLEVAKFYRCNLLVPMEAFPFVKDKNLLLTDEMKSEAIATIDKLRSFGEPVHKVIQFEKPEANCTYLRKKRLFVNSMGKLAFCHFLSCLRNTEICEIENKSLEKLIESNNKIRDNFVRKKERKLKVWTLPRKTASPCSYCLYHFGVREKW